MNLPKSFFLSPFAAVALSLALGGISQAQTASAQTASAQTASAQTASAQTASAQTASAQTASAQTASAQTASAQTASAQTASAQTASAQTASAQTASAQTASAQTAPKVAAGAASKAASPNTSGAASTSASTQAPSTGTAPTGTASTGTASTGTASTGTASTTAPVQNSVETRGTQGSAGGAAPGLVTVPDLPTTGLADVRERDASNTPELSLEDAVLEALNNNPTPKAARAQLQASLARIGQARAGGRPTASLGASSNYQRTSGGNSGNNGTVVTPGTGTGTGGTGTGGTGTGGTGTGGTGTVVTTNGGGGSSGNRTDQLSLNISIPVYTGGRVKNSQRQAEALARAQLATAQQTEQELAAQTILGYISVLQNGELLTVAQSNLDTSREQRRIAGVRFDAGAAARLEVLNADASLATAAQQRIAAANNAAQAKAALNILLARNPETPLRVQPITALQLPSAVNFPLAAQANAIAAGGTAPTSPDLRAAAEAALPSLEASRQTVTAGEYNVGVQKSARRPSISASLSDLVRNPATFVSRFVLGAGISVAQTLFSGGRIASQVAESEASLNQSRFNLTGRRLQTANAIEGSLLSLDSALKRTTSADVAVISAREALRAAQLSYSAGAGTQLDVINAQNALVSAQTNQVNARYGVAQAQVQLAAATAVTTSGSATGNSGLGSSAGTGQTSSFSTSSANQSSSSLTGTSGTNNTTQFGGTNSTGGAGTGTGNNNGGFNNGTG